MTNAKEKIGEYEVEVAGRAQCVAEIVQFLQSRRMSKSGARWLACLNPHSYAIASRDRTFSRALRSADWLVPDGSGIVLASRILRGNLKERVTGSDVFHGVLEELDKIGNMRVFFLGSTTTTLAAIETRIAADYPQVIVAGTYSPPFKPRYDDEEIQQMIDTINGKDVDVLWVGMTAPKQEKWIAEVIASLDIGFAAAIGAVFDFYTGNVKRSGPVFQRLGLEWLPRLVQEPGRLWRRTFVSAPLFLWHVFLMRIRANPAKDR